MTSYAHKTHARSQNLMKRETQTGNSLVRYPTAEGELGRGIKRPTQKVLFGACCNLNMATMSIQ
jgi:hypothetical protein